jgi:hypothetical protein
MKEVEPASTSKIRSVKKATKEHEKIGFEQKRQSRPALRNQECKKEHKETWKNRIRSGQQCGAKNRDTTWYL